MKTRLCKSPELYTAYSHTNTQVKRSLNMTYKCCKLLFYMGFLWFSTDIYIPNTSSKNK